MRVCWLAGHKNKTKPNKKACVRLRFVLQLDLFTHILYIIYRIVVVWIASAGTASFGALGGWLMRVCWWIYLGTMMLLLLFQLYYQAGSVFESLLCENLKANIKTEAKMENKICRDVKFACEIGELHRNTMVMNIESFYW